MNVKFNHDISDYEYLVWKGLTWRQLFCGVGALLSVIVFRLLLDVWFVGVGVNIPGLLIGAIFGFIGFYKSPRMRLPGEDIISLLCRYRHSNKFLNSVNAPDMKGAGAYKSLRHRTDNKESRGENNA